MEEIAALAHALGVALDTEAVRQALNFVEQFPPAATTSLQRDLAAGRASEYDALTGAMLRLAREHRSPHATPGLEVDFRILNPIGEMPAVVMPKNLYHSFRWLGARRLNLRPCDVNAAHFASGG